MIACHICSVASVTLMIAFAVWTQIPVSVRILEARLIARSIVYEGSLHRVRMV